MNYKNIMYMTVLFILLPVWIGQIWVELLKIKESFSRLLHAWVLGFVTMLAVGQLVLVPLVALEQTLTSAMIWWQALLTILAVLSFYMLLKRWCADRSSAAAEEISVCTKKENAAPNRKVWCIIWGVLAAVLILLQAYIPARYEHGDDDDARFISEEVSAYVHDTMYIDDPIAGELMFWNLGEVKKDLTSPWAMYVTICCRISEIPPAVLSHTYLPFFMVLLCYAVYFLIGHTLLKGDMEKTLMFLIVLSVVHLWGYTSTHTLASMLLLRIWQGKAVCASFMIPLFFYLMYRVMQEECEKGWICFLYVASTGACLLSGVGIITIPVILLLYGVVDFAYYRRIKKTLAVFLAAVPNAVYLLYYLIR